jgi:hypothetical protein
VEKKHITRKISSGDIIYPFDLNEQSIGEIKDNFFLLWFRFHMKTKGTHNVFKPLFNIRMHKEQGKCHKVMTMT